jgi:phage gp29-like protein
MLPEISHLTVRQIEHILRGALFAESPAAEHALYTLMLRTSPRLSKNVSELKNAVLSLDWSICTEDETPPAWTALLERTQNGMRGEPCRSGLGWRGTLETLLDGWFRGVSVVGIEWEGRGGSRYPAAVLPRQTFRLAPEHYGWSATSGDFTFHPDADRQEGTEFPPHQYLIAIHNTAAAHPSGGALLRPLVWWWLAANFSQEWLLNFAQIFGVPIRWATYDPTQDGVREALSEAMETMGSAAWSITPTGTEIKLLEATKGAGDNPQRAILELFDTACDLLILGQTLTTDVGDSGSRALGEVHSSVRADVIDSAAQWLAEVLNEQLVPSLITQHTGDPGEEAALPYWEPGRKERKDSKLVAETLEILARAGLPVPLAWAYEALDIPAPQPGEATVGTPATTTPGDAAAPPSPDLRRLLAKLPLDAREYMMARLIHE